MIIMASWIILTLAASGMAAPADARQGVTTDRVRILEVSPGPRFVSGVLATAIRFTGRSAREKRVYYIPFLEEDQVRPRVGETCEVAWRWRWTPFSWIAGGGENVTEGPFVQSLRCGDRRWPD
ncbi:MAG TPA: hypothetical protein VF603_08315 [Allosphingosinicella sp.]|jgi:hypothetical protein